MKKIALILLLAIIPRLQSPLFAQDPSANVPDDSSTAMTTEQGDPIGNTDAPNNENVPADPNYSPPEGPFAPELPDTANYEGPVGVTGIFNGNVATAGSYDPLSHSAHRAIDDIVVPGSIGKYPLKMTRYYNSRQQYYAWGAIGLSPGWAHEYSWLMWGGGTKVISPHGGVQDFYCGGPVGVSEGWEGAHSSGSGTWRLADGGKVIFENSRVIYIDDPYGQRTTIEYDGNWYRTKVTEPGGRYLKFIYGPTADPDGTLMLTRVEAHALGNATVTDWVNYSYTSVSPGVEGRNKMMLTRVDYPDSNPNDLSDNTHAHYQYCNDNVHEGELTHKVYPLLWRCDDVRYNEAMRNIWYDYENAGPHGAIVSEHYPGSGAISAVSPGATGHIFTESRGDGPTRRFTYTTAPSCHNNECGPCDAYEINPPQQMLLSYTDFQDHTTQIGYDTNTWYVTSVTDTNNHTTLYDRGPAPPAGIGQIIKITHPDSSHIDYTYYDESPNISGHYLQSVTDERGAYLCDPAHTTTYRRDQNYRVNRIEYPHDASTPVAVEEFTYNNFGQVLTHQLKNGAYQHFQYSGRGLLLAKTNPTWNSNRDNSLANDPKTTYTYYTAAPWADRLFKMTLPTNGSNQTASERYEYDRSAYPPGAAVPGRGLVTKIIHADGTWQSFGYSQFGNKMWEENELRQRTTYEYDNYNRVLSVTKPLVGAETFSYLKPGTDSPYLHTTNSIYTHTTRAGIVTTNQYDTDWRKTSTTIAGARTQFAYDHVGNLTDITDPRAKVTHNEYDNRNRKTSTTEAYGIQGLAATTVWHYNSVGSIFKIDRPDGQSETKGYDGLNRVAWHTVPRQVVGGGQVNVTARIFYNPSGTVQKVRNENGRDTVFDYDPSDRKTKMWYPGHTQLQQWGYDDVGNLENRTTVNGERQDFEYDILNRKIGMSWTNGADFASYGYDDAGRLTSANNANSNVTRIYDAAGRLTHDQQHVIGLGIKDVSYPLYDDDGRVKRLSAAGIYDYTFGYDGMGRFETISASGSVKFRYVYDAASNETDRYAYFNGVTIDQIYGRDSLDRMSSRVLKKNGAIIPGTTESYTYDHMNRLTEVNRDGVADSFAYYWTGELLSANYGGGSELPYHEGQDPDLDTADTVDPNAGYHPPEMAEAEPPPPPDDTPPPDPTADTTPSPDSTPPSDTPPAEDPTKGQKTVDDYLGDGKQGPEGPAPDLPTGRSVRYTLDKAGNRTSVSDDVNGNATYWPNNLNQYTSVDGRSVTNGPEHEIRVYNTVTYDYINDEHLKRVASSAGTYNLYYDALGRCVKRILNSATTYHIYDGEKPILEYRSTDLSNPAKNVYGKGIDEILMRYDPTLLQNQTFYYQQDHEGSVTHLLNTSGNVIESYKYDAFGAPTILAPDGVTVRSASIVSNRFLFTGREYSALFGFYEYRARAYHPTLGRFMSEDPKLFDAGDYNLFRYCHNDPIDFTDPMGLDFLSSTQDFVTGAGDSLSLGATAYIRDSLPGIYGFAGVNTNSTAYRFGEGSGLVLGMGTGEGEAAAARAGIRGARQVAAVIGKMPNYLKVAEQMGAKRFYIRPEILAKMKMSPKELWVANQKFLDRAIARGGDFVLDKAIKSINSVSGGLRKELDYLSRKGFELSKDGSRMVRSPLQEAQEASRRFRRPELP